MNDSKFAKFAKLKTREIKALYSMYQQLSKTDSVFSFYEVISVSLHMSVITQDGEPALMIAAREGWTEVVSLLLMSGANTDLQNEVK